MDVNWKAIIVIAVLLYVAGYSGSIILGIIPGQTGLVAFALAVFVPAVILYYLLKHFKKDTGL